VQQDYILVKDLAQPNVLIAMSTPKAKITSIFLGRDLAASYSLVSMTESLTLLASAQPYYSFKADLFD